MFTWSKKIEIQKCFNSGPQNFSKLKKGTRILNWNIKEYLDVAQIPWNLPLIPYGKNSFFRKFKKASKKEHYHVIYLINL